MTQNECIIVAIHIYNQIVDMVSPYIRKLDPEEKLMDIGNDMVKCLEAPCFIPEVIILMDQCQVIKFFDIDIQGYFVKSKVYLMSALLQVDDDAVNNLLESYSKKYRRLTDLVESIISNLNTVIFKFESSGIVGKPQIEMVESLRSRYKNLQNLYIHYPIEMISLEMNSVWSYFRSSKELQIPKELTDAHQLNGLLIKETRELRKLNEC